MNVCATILRSLCRSWLRLSVLMLTLTLLAACVHGQMQAPQAVLLIATGEKAEHNIATITRDVLVEGQVQGDVTSWTGSIHIAGHVSGDVVSYGGGVVLDESALVEGNVLTLIGHVQQIPGAQIAGQLVETDVGRQTIASVIDVSDAPPPLVTAEWPGYALLSIALAFLAGALALGSIVVWPHRTARTARTYLAARGRSTAIGLLTTLILAIVLLLLSALLAVTLIGMPLILLLILLLNIPYFYGLVVLARAMPGMRARGETMQPEARIYLVPLVVILLLLPCIVIGIVSPLAGLIGFYALSSGGLGAAILSRGGVLAPLSVAQQH